MKREHCLARIFQTHCNVQLGCGWASPAIMGREWVFFFFFSQYFNFLKVTICIKCWNYRVISLQAYALISNGSRIWAADFHSVKFPIYNTESLDSVSLSCGMFGAAHSVSMGLLTFMVSIFSIPTFQSLCLGLAPCSGQLIGQISDKASLITWYATFLT